MVVGAGFGGIKVAHGLRLAACRVTVIDKRNYHLFQPLLYQVATASLSPADVATPIERCSATSTTMRVLLGEVTDVDTATRQVVLSDGSHIGYDYLVLATGARHSYFGRDDWEPYAPGLKAHRRRHRHPPPAVVGLRAGRELRRSRRTAAVADLHHRRRRSHRRGAGRCHRRTGSAWVDWGNSVTSTRPKRGCCWCNRRRVCYRHSPSNSRRCRRNRLRALGVEVLTKSRVEKVDAEGALVSGQRIGSPPCSGRRG